MTCTDVREILSDLIDVRNGEIPPVGASKLSEPEMRADAETHLASCSDCRAEMIVLEEVGAVFADFNVGELPVQHFANYGQRVRERMTINERKIVPIRAAGMSRWWKVGASTAAAACIAFAVVHFMPHKVKSTIANPVTNTEKVATLRTVKPYTPLTTFTNTKPISGIMQASQGIGTPSPALIPKGKMSLEDLRDYELKNGSVIISDMPVENDGPLLGAVVKTIRDEDHDLTKVGSMGLRVFDVVPDSVANEMGLMKNDIIVCINGMDVNSGGVKDAFNFITAIQNLGKSAPVTIDVVRQDKYGVQYKRCRGVLGEPKGIFE